MYLGNFVLFKSVYQDISECIDILQHDNNKTQTKITCKPSQHFVLAFIFGDN